MHSAYAHAKIKLHIPMLLADMTNYRTWRRSLSDYLCRQSALHLVKPENNTAGSYEQSQQPHDRLLIKREPDSGAATTLGDNSQGMGGTGQTADAIPMPLLDDGVSEDSEGKHEDTTVPMATIDEEASNTIAGITDVEAAFIGDRQPYLSASDPTRYEDSTEANLRWKTWEVITQSLYNCQTILVGVPKGNIFKLLQATLVSRSATTISTMEAIAALGRLAKDERMTCNTLLAKIEDLCERSRSDAGLTITEIMKTSSLLRACAFDPSFREFTQYLSKRRPRPSYVTVVRELRVHEQTVKETRALTNRGHPSRAHLAVKRGKAMCKHTYLSNCTRPNCPYKHKSKPRQERAHQAMDDQAINYKKKKHGPRGGPGDHKPRGAQGKPRQRGPCWDCGGPHLRRECPKGGGTGGRGNKQKGKQHAYQALAGLGFSDSDDDYELVDGRRKEYAHLAITSNDLTYLADVPEALQQLGKACSSNNAGDGPTHAHTTQATDSTMVTEDEDNEPPHGQGSTGPEPLDTPEDTTGHGRHRRVHYMGSESAMTHSEERYASLAHSLPPSETTAGPLEGPCMHQILPGRASCDSGVTDITSGGAGKMPASEQTDSPPTIEVDVTPAEAIECALLAQQLGVTAQRALKSRERRNLRKDLRRHNVKDRTFWAIVDSGASNYFLRPDVFNAYATNVRVQSGELETAGQPLRITAVGDLQCRCTTTGHPLLLRGALRVDGLNDNLISVPKLARHGHSVHYDKDGVTLARADNAKISISTHDLSGVHGVHLTATGRRSPPWVTELGCLARTHTGALKPNLVIHRKLAHTYLKSAPLAKRLRRAAPKALDVLDHSCATCHQCKGHSFPHKRKQDKVLATRSQDRIHLDVVELPTQGLHGGRYALIGYLEYSSKLLVNTRIPTKAHLPQAVVRMLKHARQLSSAAVNSVTCHSKDDDTRFLTMRSDQGTEFINRELQAYCERVGMQVEYSCAYEKQQNGYAEGAVRIVTLGAETCRTHAGLPRNHWDVAMEYFVHTHGHIPNRSRTSAPSSWTPNERVAGRVSEYRDTLSWLHPLGCLCYVRIPKQLRKHTHLELKALPAVFLGYSSDKKGYIVRFLANAKVYDGVYACTFDETLYPLQIGPSELRNHLGKHGLHENGTLSQRSAHKTSVQTDATPEAPTCGLSGEPTSTLTASKTTTPQTFVQTAESGKDAILGEKMPGQTLGTLAGTHPKAPALSQITQNPVEPFYDQIICVPRDDPVKIEDPPENSGDPATDAAPHTTYTATDTGAAACADDRDDDGLVGALRDAIDATAAEHLAGDTDGDASTTTTHDATTDATIATRVSTRAQRAPSVASLLSAANTPPRRARTITETAKRATAQDSNTSTRKPPSSKLPRWERDYLQGKAPYDTHDAEKRPDKMIWREARKKWWAKMRKYKVLKLVKPPPGHHNVMDARWIYAWAMSAFDETSKGTKDGAIQPQPKRGKAKYVIRGFSGIKGLDHFLTSSPVTSMAFYRILEVLAVVFRWPLRVQLDIEAAYLNARPVWKQFMKQPKGEEIPGKIFWVYLLLRSVPGVKDAGRCWYLTLTEVLKKIGMTRLGGEVEGEPCIWYCSDNGHFVLIVFHVDDLAAWSNDEDYFNRAFRSKIEREFEVKLAVTNVFVGITSRAEPKEGTTTLTAHTYFDRAAEAAGVESSARQYHYPALLGKHGKFCPSDVIPQGDARRTELNQLPYAKVLMTLAYGVRCCRPDMAYMTSYLQRFCHNYGKKHWKALLHLVHYGMQTRDKGLVYKRASKLPICAYTDASHQGCPITQTSHMGWVIKLFGNVVDWSSRRVPGAPSLSSAEAELYALVELIKAIIEVRELLGLLSAVIGRELVPGPTPIFEDNKAACDLGVSMTASRKLRHVKKMVQFVRYHVQVAQTVVLVQTPTEEQQADAMTKVENTFAKQAQALLTPDTEPRMEELARKQSRALSSQPTPTTRFALDEAAEQRGTTCSSNNAGDGPTTMNVDPRITARGGPASGIPFRKRDRQASSSTTVGVVTRSAARRRTSEGKQPPSETTDDSSETSQTVEQQPTTAPAAGADPGDDDPSTSSNEEELVPRTSRPCRGPLSYHEISPSDLALYDCSMILNDRRLSVDAELTKLTAMGRGMWNHVYRQWGRTHPHQPQRTDSMKSRLEHLTHWLRTLVHREGSEDEQAERIISLSAGVACLNRLRVLVREILSGRHKVEELGGDTTEFKECCLSQVKIMEDELARAFRLHYSALDVTDRHHACTIGEYTREVYALTRVAKALRFSLERQMEEKDLPATRRQALGLQSLGTALTQTLGSAHVLRGRIIMTWPTGDGRHINRTCENTWAALDAVTGCIEGLGNSVKQLETCIASDQALRPPRPRNMEPIWAEGYQLVSAGARPYHWCAMGNVYTPWVIAQGNTLSYRCYPNSHVFSCTHNLSRLAPGGLGASRRHPSEAQMQKDRYALALRTEYFAADVEGDYYGSCTRVLDATNRHDIKGFKCHARYLSTVTRHGQLSPLTWHSRQRIQGLRDTLRRVTLAFRTTHQRLRDFARNTGQLSAGLVRGVVGLANFAHGHDRVVHEVLEELDVACGDQGRVVAISQARDTELDDPDERSPSPTYSTCSDDDEPPPTAHWEPDDPERVRHNPYPGSCQAIGCEGVNPEDAQQDENLAPRECPDLLMGVGNHPYGSLWGFGSCRHMPFHATKWQPRCDAFTETFAATEPEKAEFWCKLSTADIRDSWNDVCLVTSINQAPAYDPHHLGYELAHHLDKRTRDVDSFYHHIDCPWMLNRPLNRRTSVIEGLRYDVADPHTCVYAPYVFASTYIIARRRGLTQAECCSHLFLPVNHDRTRYDQLFNKQLAQSNGVRRIRSHLTRALSLEEPLTTYEDNFGPMP